MLKFAIYFSFLFFYTGCNKSLNNEQINTTENQFMTTYTAKQLAGNWSTGCQINTPADSDTVSSFLEEVVIFQEDSRIKFKIYLTDYTNENCAGDETPQLHSEGEMKLQDNKLDIISHTKEPYGFFGNRNINETVYTTIKIQDHDLRFVKTRNNTGFSPESRLTFDMVDPLFTFEIILKQYATAL